ncbi:MAG: transcriptional regulator, Crp/Fnr family [Candidatus Ozemobacter sibiricus]|uniref:Transcriptional regulator, Crp/Fnr family n=1 Tax=Candidatus Ozemobacter sibiricus TaxID=2268124 RepID=A0A367ZJT2_9BACT|nr:MAG: transcriptional regulator, Crp/Fnr family [Candidatus Ozemobacter sibiricus]
MSLAEKLREFEVLSGFSMDDLEQLASLMEEVAYEDGQTIIDEQSQSTALFFILSGRVKIHKMLAGQLKILTLLDKYDLFGEVAFVDNMVRSASATTVGPVKIAKFTSEHFTIIKKQNPTLAVEFLIRLTRELSRKFRAVNEGLDIKSSEHTINELILSGQQVRVSTTNDVDYLCTIKYADKTQNFPLMKIEVKGKIILIPFHQIKSIHLADRYGHY